MGDKLVNLGSGTLVGENLVLTAAHVVYDYINTGVRNFFSDSIMVFPAFDNGRAQPNLPNTMVEKCFVFKSFYDHKRWDDIALMQLEKPIGRETGWTGMAFQMDTSFFRNKVFHKFSYPDVPDIQTFPPRNFNSDTLFYNYGFIRAQEIRYPDGPVFHLESENTWGIPGQSGSGLLYGSNGAYFSYGVLNFSADMFHYQISSQVFYQFRNVM